MKVLNKEDETFIHGAAYKARIWHTCKDYKNGKRGTIRAEMEKILPPPVDGEEYTEEEIKKMGKQPILFRCPHCKFEKTVDSKIKAV